MDQLVVLIVQRKFAHILIGLVGSNAKTILRLFICTHHAGCNSTKGHSNSTSKGGKVDNRTWLVTVCIAKSIRKNESAFCIRIVDLSGLTVHERQNIAGNIGRSAWHVLC